VGGKKKQWIALDLFLFLVNLPVVRWRDCFNTAVIAGAIGGCPFLSNRRIVYGQIHQAHEKGALRRARNPSSGKSNSIAGRF
jgi:hypothetical protein